jgi:ABC-type hemin transport system ATPase subunit
VARPRDEKLANTATEDVVVVEGLRMRYRAAEAVAGIDLRVAGGEIFAFLGPNGAGKTTTLEILEGFASEARARSPCWLSARFLQNRSDAVAPLAAAVARVDAEARRSRGESGARGR